MKHPTMLGAAILAAAVTISLFGASAASADFLCTENAALCPAGKEITELEASGASVILNGPENAIYSKCEGSKINLNIELQGAGISPNGELTSLTWAGCSATTQTVNKGGWFIDNIAGSTDGEVLAAGTEITVNGAFGDCTYKAGAGEETKLGILESGAKANFKFVARLNKTGGGFLCTSKATWSGEYLIENHTAVYVRKS